MTKHTVLFLTANPLGTDRLALDEEARAIQVELERSGHRDQFELVTRWAAQPLDLLRELRRLKPTVVHFSGHGSRGASETSETGSGASRDVVGGAGFSSSERGLFFHGADGRPQLVSTTALEETFGAAGGSVKVVVLSACYSAMQAAALAKHVDCVVGMAGSIRDDAARSFAIGFYGGLGEHESVAGAYRQGRAAVSLAGLPDRDRPQLRVRDGVEVEQLLLGFPVDHMEARDISPSIQRPPHRNTNGTLSGKRTKKIPALDETRRDRDRSRLRWSAIGTAAICFLSGGVASAVSPMPVKGVLGLLGAGMVVIALALAFERVPRDQRGSVLKFFIASIVILLLGLAYAYKALVASSDDHERHRMPSPASGDAGGALAREPAPSRPASLFPFLPELFKGHSTNDSDSTSNEQFASSSEPAEMLAIKRTFQNSFVPLREPNEQLAIKGSGSTFQKPYQEAAIEELAKSNKNMKINYGGGGSGRGRQDLTDQIVDFAGTDSPYKDADLSKNKGGDVLYFPILLGAITVSYTLDGIDKLRLSPATIAKMFQCDIKKWNDPDIAADNPDTKLPDADIVVVHRSDNCSTTDNFTEYLDKTAKDVWKLGSGPTVRWPAYTAAGNGNPGVAQIVKTTRGAIGYVDLSDAKASGLKSAMIRNQAGKYVEASSDTASAAGDGIEIKDNLVFSALDPKGATAYPITYPSWVIVYAKQSDLTKVKMLRWYIMYLLTDGQKQLAELDFAPLPKRLAYKALMQLVKIQVGGSP